MQASGFWLVLVAERREPFLPHRTPLYTFVGNVVFVAGSRKQRSRAEDYIAMVLSKLEIAELILHATALFSDDRDDRTLLDVQLHDVAYITGKGRETLAEMEDKFGVLMVFMQSVNIQSDDTDSDRLAIFVPLRGRTCAEIDIMSCVEKNNPGTFTTGLHDQTVTDDCFSTDRIAIDDKQTVGYIVGQNSASRIRLSRASGAHMQFVGHSAYRW